MHVTTHKTRFDRICNTANTIIRIDSKKDWATANLFIRVAFLSCDHNLTCQLSLDIVLGSQEFGC